MKGTRLEVGVCSVKDLIELMDAEDGGYENWGICEEDGALWLGPDNEKQVLKVPLSDIMEMVYELYPEYGFEELAFTFCSEKIGAITWDVAPGEEETCPHPVEH